MLDIYDMFLVGGIFCGFITSLLLFFQARRYQRHANLLLSLALFPIAWYAFIYLILKTGAIIHVPVLFRAGSPLYYLIGPCSYLYVRSVIMDEDRFRKWDWVHFLPAILHLIELMPFFLTDAETKREIVREITQRFNTSYQKGSGLVPAIWHFMLRPVHALIYLVFQWALLIRAVNRKNNYTIQPQVFRSIRAWLFGSTTLITIIMVGLLVQTVVGVMLAKSSVPVTSASGYMQIVMTFAFFIMSAYLFFKPDILYGTLKTNAERFIKTVNPSPEPPAAPKQQPVATEPAVITVATGKENTGNEDEPAARRETLLNEELIKLYSDKVEEHLACRQSFRRKGLTINQLADELCMPVHHLSYVLNHLYKQRFSDFINQHRVEYVRQLFTEEENRVMKLEILAEKAGFSSRSNFFAMFKKFTGVTPADYIRQAEQKRTA